MYLAVVSLMAQSSGFKLCFKEPWESAESLQGLLWRWKGGGVSGSAPSSSVPATPAE